MSQQINLLARERKPTPAWVFALGSVVLVVMAALVYYAELTLDARQLQREVNSAALEIEVANVALQTLQKRLLPEKDVAALKSEITELKPRAVAIAQTVDEIQSGSIGGANGFAAHFTTLAQVIQGGLWIHNVAIANGGKSVTVTGRALRNEAVMQYAQQLNTAFASLGVQFSSLDLTPEMAPQPRTNAVGVAGPARPASVVFKLY